jgi:nickel transport protein
MMAVLMFPMSTSTFAHELRLFATAEGKEIAGRVYFEGGDGVAGAKITVLGPDHEVLREVITGPGGRFRFEVRLQADHILHARTIDLHEAEILIKRTDLAGLHAASSDEPAATNQVVELQEELTRLREELDRTKHEIRLRDILGGIGLILGLFGLLILWKRAAP